MRKVNNRKNYRSRGERRKNCYLQYRLFLDCPVLLEGVYAFTYKCWHLGYLILYKKLHLNSLWKVEKLFFWMLRLFFVFYNNMATLSRTPLFAKPHTDSDGDRSSERGREGERGRVALFRKKLFQSPITKRGNGAEWERERRENERMNDMTAERYSSGICRFSSI